MPSTGCSCTVLICSTVLFIGLTQSKKTFLMSTPKCLGAQIFRFTWVKLTMNPPYQTVTKAVHCIQLYILSSFIYIVTLYILSFGVEQLDRSVMHLFL